VQHTRTDLSVEKKITAMQALMTDDSAQRKNCNSLKFIKDLDLEVDP